MGRKKKERIEVSEDSISFVKSLIKEYPIMKKKCVDMEVKRPAMLKRGGIDPSVFSMDVAPSEKQFIEPYDAGNSNAQLAEYMEQRERVYLLERGIWVLEGLPHDVAEALFLHGKSWDAVMSELYISHMTVGRARNEAIRSIAKDIDDYMTWKARVMFG